MIALIILDVSLQKPISLTIYLNLNILTFEKSLWEQEYLCQSRHFCLGKEILNLKKMLDSACLHLQSNSHPALRLRGIKKNLPLAFLFPNLLSSFLSMIRWLKSPSMIDNSFHSLLACCHLNTIPATSETPAYLSLQDRQDLVH